MGSLAFLPVVKRTPNPEYNPDWESIQGEMSAELERAEHNFDYVSTTTRFTPEQGAAAYIQRETARDNYYATFRLQFETVEEYATWLFQSSPVYADKEHQQQVQPDLANIHSLDDAVREWREQTIIAGKMPGVQKNSLPATHDRIFSNDTVTSTWRSFPDPRGNEDISTLVTTEKFGATTRVCFMADPKTRDTARCSINVIESLATAIYHQACEDSRPENLRGVFGLHKKPHPDQFEFFVHIPPECGIHESFSHIDMRYDYRHGRFTDAQWEKMEKIPVTVQRARFVDHHAAILPFKPVVQPE